MTDAEKLAAKLREVYEAMDGSDMAMRYDERHGIQSAAILTMHNEEDAAAMAAYLAPRIVGKTVIEIGGGIGILGCHLAGYAKHVYCIEANPAWSWVFAKMLYAVKPKNLSYLFGAAEEFVHHIHGDVAVFLTHSAIGDLRRLAHMFAPVVIDPYGEILAGNPQKFDPIAITLRGISDY